MLRTADPLIDINLDDLLDALGLQTLRGAWPRVMLRPLVGRFTRTVRAFDDRVGAAGLADASAWVLPMWMYRALMLAWAFWMAWFLIRIGRSVFESWTAGGAWAPWRRPKPKAPESEPPPLEAALQEPSSAAME